MTRRHFFIAAGIACVAAAVAIHVHAPVADAKHAAVAQLGILALAFAAVCHFTLAAAGSGAPLQSGVIALYAAGKLLNAWQLLAVVAVAITIRYVLRISAAPQGRPDWEEQPRRAARQEQRDLLARQLQDSIRKQVAVMRDSISEARAELRDGMSSAAPALDDAVLCSREAMNEIDALLDQISVAPSTPEALAAAIERQCRAIEIRTGAKVEWSASGLPSGDGIGPRIQELYRIAQEALSNVARHARASVVRVSLSSTKDNAEFRVEDNGAGFNADSKMSGMGLRNMRERATALGGKTEISSVPGRTLVAVTIPLPAASRPRIDGWHLVLAASIVLFLFSITGVFKPPVLSVAVSLSVNLFITYLRRERWQQREPDFVTLGLGDAK